MPEGKGTTVDMENNHYWFGPGSVVCVAAEGARGVGWPRARVRVEGGSSRWENIDRIGEVVWKFYIFSSNTDMLNNLSVWSRNIRHLGKK